MTEKTHNQKERLLWCPKCRTDTINDKLDPSCEVCGSKLITVTFSVIDGSRITPLASPELKVK